MLPLRRPVHTVGALGSAGKAAESWSCDGFKRLRQFEVISGLATRFDAAL
jgi:hypothetical protein